jgi:hypothetical protein
MDHPDKPSENYGVLGYHPNLYRPVLSPGQPALTGTGKIRVDADRQRQLAAKTRNDARNCQATLDRLRVLAFSNDKDAIDDALEQAEELV